MLEECDVLLKLSNCLRHSLNSGMKAMMDMVMTDPMDGIATELPMSFLSGHQ